MVLRMILTLALLAVLAGAGFYSAPSGNSEGSTIESPYTHGFDVGERRSPPTSKKAAQAERNPASKRVTWHDGEKLRQCWLDRRVLVEFDPSPEGKALIESLSNGAQVLDRHGSRERWWQLPANDSFTALENRIRQQAPDCRTSPLFRLGSGQGRRTQSLPGGVVVRFVPETTEAQVFAWTAARGLEIERRLSTRSPLYLLWTPPGLESLDLANDLHEEPEVVAATPNWRLDLGRR